MIKLYKARSLLYRRQILQVNIRLKALDEVYEIYTCASFGRKEPKLKMRQLKCVLSFIFFGNNEPGAVGTIRWWPPGIALQKRRFSKKDGK